MGRERIDGERHREIRAGLRFFGPSILAIGIVLTVIGVGSFFVSFGSAGPPKYFWCAFLGLPLVAVGMGICKFAYLGTIGRYIAGESAPVMKDTFNYLADGTKDGIEDVARAVGEGLRGQEASREARAVVRCHKCNEANDADARFCKACGAALVKSRTCPSCRERNDPDARFCDNCGKAL